MRGNVQTKKNQSIRLYIFILSHSDVEKLYSMSNHDYFILDISDINSMQENLWENGNKCNLWCDIRNQLLHQNKRLSNDSMAYIIYLNSVVILYSLYQKVSRILSI